jgi:hypothetical protein
MLSVLASLVLGLLIATAKMRISSWPVDNVLAHMNW